MLGMNADGGGPLDGIAHVKHPSGTSCNPDRNLRDAARLRLRAARPVDRPIGHLTMELYAATVKVLTHGSRA